MKIAEIELNKEYFYLTILNQVNGRIFEAKCRCGNIKNIDVNQIPRVKSCGCYNSIAASKRMTSYSTKYDTSITKHKLYNTYNSIKNRCYSKSYSGYLGGKIKICEEWLGHYDAFYKWAIDTWFPKSILIRLNNDLDFYPDNCKFVQKSVVCAANGRKSGHKRKGLKVKKETLEKIKATNLKKYGVEFALQSSVIQNKCRQTVFEKYGVNHSSQIPGSRQKAKNTSLKKYGTEHYSQSESGRLIGKSNTIKSGQAYVFNGKMTDELAKESGVSRSTMNARIRKYGFEIAVSMDRTQTEIERVIESILVKNGIDFIKQFKVENRIADFFLPEYKLIIEADGLYWHSDAINDSKNYHKLKRDLYSKHGYHSVFFREDEISRKLSIVESIILNKIGKSSRVFARKCVIEKVKKVAAKEFLNHNHLMGNGKGRSIALVYGGEIMAIMQFTNKSEYLEISRFCTKSNVSVIGAFSRLLKAGISHFKPKKIITFIDLRYGNGEYLTRLGFNKVGQHLSFCWVKNDKAVHRMIYRSNTGYENGWHKFWDCGQAKYELLVK